MSAARNLTPPPTPRVWHLNPAVRFLPGLCILSAMIVTWGCAGHREHAPATIRCPDSVHTTVSVAKPTVSVSYTEPSVTIDGKPLTGLAKTTIYYDLGSGRMLAKEIPATTPVGGGHISETITLPTHATGGQTVWICVTATNQYGNESTMNP